MKRNIIEIDEDKCVGCGLCVNACHQGALQLVDGKAKLLSDSYCDGLGKCLPACPVGALKVIEKEVNAFEEKEKKASACSCPSTVAKKLNREQDDEGAAAVQSRLGQWPCQIKLVSPNSPYFDGADLLIAADCCAFSYGDFHRKFMQDKITLIGCPKLDDIDYSDKLADIIRYNDINSVTVTRMTVPCCSGMTMAVQRAIQASGKEVPLTVHIINTDGELQSNK